VISKLDFASHNSSCFFSHHTLPTGYLIVLGFGAAFSVFTTALVYMEKHFAGGVEMTSEQFK
jgi:hypothetical protein